MIYSAVKEYLYNQGERLLKINPDILTNEKVLEIEHDIEDGFTKLLAQHHVSVPVFGEDISRQLPTTDSYWVIDAISGTNQFIAGSPEYALCVAEVKDGEIIYAVVVAPGHSEVFEAKKGQGVLFNNEPLRFSKRNVGDLILNLDPSSTLDKLQEQIWRSTFYLFPFILNQASILSYCRVVQRRYSRIISVSKDSFPYFAGTFLINESGGLSTNIEGMINIRPSDRIFLGAVSDQIHKETMNLCESKI